MAKKGTPEWRAEQRRQAQRAAGKKWRAYGRQKAAASGETKPPMGARAAGREAKKALAVENSGRWIPTPARDPRMGQVPVRKVTVRKMTPEELAEARGRAHLERPRS